MQRAPLSSHGQLLCSVQGPSCEQGDTGFQFFSFMFVNIVLVFRQVVRTISMYASRRVAHGIKLSLAGSSSGVASSWINEVIQHNTPKKSSFLDSCVSFRFVGRSGNNLSRYKKTCYS